MALDSLVLINRLPKTDGQGLAMAVSGGIGAGKSTVSATLAELGAQVVSADQISHDLTAGDGDALPPIRAAFGSAVFRADGSLDRQQLAKRVFGDDEARARLERIMHPLIQARARSFLDAVEPGKVRVYDIPLLVETGFETDLVLIVWAPLQVRVQRLIGRGLSEDEARARMAAQVSDTERLQVADVVVNNSGKQEEVRRAIEEVLWPRLLERA
ncbi:dephospho-CoA kinase [Winkia sp. UMB3158]|uniref:Dephospho-CoA kinase n=2 Tax=Winkia neuii TaxID=33007 RepID=A0AB38XLN5_9ACTO|nr:MULTISPECIES: dephospho-CoA kinase [Winkia]MDK6241003.1 dephospho-CoA kinase [Winkia sp. UMB10116]MDK7149496.1 dephospho-CoA kinase [Winkia sp. UMB3158]MDK7227778.1 dephospho-CoA kinase [Winkia sp. UMB1185]MDK7905211.1 dephospho-CoA kinase [Winkia sp. UMB0889B]MDK8224368.1 dephospho-CoA kinase [Winkia sp. UMB750B]